MSSKRVAIIGAGASGLVAIKCCLDEGLEPVCFERDNHIGGLWHYTEDVADGHGCVSKTTVINTAKEIMCFSDFPIPKDFPNYMHHSKVLEYFHLFVKHFDLEKYIQFGVEVPRVARAGDFAESGKWDLDIKDKSTGQTRAETFDAVLLCTGHHAAKSVPRFEGDDVFEGRIMHSHEYRSHQGFEDMKVVVVGIGNSGGDAAVDLSRIAEQVYLSTRRGSWVANRVGADGIPIQHETLRRFTLFLRSLLPKSTAEGMIHKRLNKRFDHATYRLLPKHGYFAQHPMVNDDLPNRIICGKVVVKPDVRRFTKTGVEFDDGSFVDGVDVIILATGYQFGFPFLEKGVIDVEGNHADLFKYVFPPHLERSTIAAIGFVQPVGAVNPISEMQCRWATRVFKGLAKLPSQDAMMCDIRKKHEVMARRYVASPRHTIQVDYVPYMDELADQFGVRPNMAALLLTDPKLAIAACFGPWSPYQYRLTGSCQWSGAREAMLTIWDRILAPFETRPAVQQTGGRPTFVIPAVSLALVAVCVGVVWRLKLKG